MDTIFALASAQGRAGVSVIRISGPQAVEVFAAFGAVVPPARRAVVQHLKGVDGAVVDEAVTVLFAAPHSFTGEDVVELQCHGSIAVVRQILQRLGDLPGLRMAEPGEFTRRALENHRMDIAQVEALGDLIDAETEAQRLQAQRVLSGHLGQRVDVWRKDLIRAAALIEAVLDFADEDVPVDVTPEVRELLSGLLHDLTSQAAGIRSAEAVRRGFRVAIVGAPNAGKSTLLNALARRDVAITSEIAGTTRDVIEVRADVAGIPVTFLDTAGLREAQDEIEAVGVQRAMDAADQADLRVFLLERDHVFKHLERSGDIVVWGKADLRDDADGSVSGKTGAGLDELERRVAEELGARVSGVGLAINERHRVAIEAAIVALTGAYERLSAQGDDLDLVAEDLRAALRALDLLVGRIDVENLLSEIFSSFCIGK